MLTRVEGPECPYCGCQESTLVSQETRWGQPVRRLRCEFCHAVFREPPGGETKPKSGDQPAGEKDQANGRGVPYFVVRCPRCQADRTRITSTRRPVRYHKCLVCEHTFKSVERGEGRGIRDWGLGIGD